MHNIKRNKRVTSYLQEQLKRIGIDISISDFLQHYIAPELNTSETIALTANTDVLDNDTILIETLKLIGLMEVSKSKDELDKLIIKREQIEGKKKELTDFDKILKGIMKVPNKDKSE